MKNLVFVLTAVCLVLFLPLQAGAQFPTISLIEQISGLNAPVHITHAGDGSGRLFIVEQGGRIRIVRNNVLQAVPFLDISGRVLFGGEQGLLSVAFPPQFNVKNYFYVYYTNLAGDNVAARYFLTANPDVADPNSEVILRTFLHPINENHNGGQLAFGPDGFLYMATGDGGSAGDPPDNAQNPLSFLGKMLRIDVESPVTPPALYNIPPTNPFIGNPNFLPEIWAVGLRNPFRFSFDRLTGDLFIGDVGQNLFEEVDFQPAASPGGENYGWDIMEGLSCFNELDFFNPLPVCNQAGLVLPVVDYSHADGNCSVTGGFVYRGNLHPQLQGIYFYADFCSGRIWGLRRNGAVWENSLLLDSPFGITTFGEDEAGEVYLTDYSNGVIYRIAVSATGDFDGDGRTDIAIYRAGNGVWFVIPSSGAPPFAVGWGGDPTDKPVPGDYDADGKADVAVYRTGGGIWFIIPSAPPASPFAVGWGGDPTDKPVPGDYDADGKTDLAVYRAGNGIWFVVPSATPASPLAVSWGGNPADRPAPGDYDGDGKTDAAVYRQGIWFIRPSSGAAPSGVAWGEPLDIPVPGNYDGDTKTDIAVYRGNTGVWFVIPSSGAAPFAVGWGGDATDKPAPGDYDGDGRTDTAVYRGSNGVWFVIPSSGAAPFTVGWGGDPSDVPVSRIVD